MTPDGHSVFFTTDTGLLADDDNGGTDLYRWTESADPASDANLTMISQNGDLNTSLVVGISDDGERVYYQASSTDQIFVWDHGTTHLVTGGVGTSGTLREQLGVTTWGPGLGRLTPDGRYFAFATDRSSGGIGPTGDVTNGHFEMYFYTLGGVLRCISCPAGPATADVTVIPAVAGGVPSYTIPGIRPHFLSDRGHVFFSTAEVLVPQDVNGVTDTYEYDPATDRVSLISSGKGSDPATFTDASASGDDVFLVTRQRLVASDHDDLVDLYDARVGSSLPDPPEQPTPACEGETCQPPPSAPPGEEALGTSLSGSGNVKQSRKPRCNKNQKKVRRNGKTRCVKKHTKRANTNRRAGR